MTLKFKKPHVIRARYRIVTPMFIGDAEQKASGISPASVKGALRFWWRALNWGCIRSKTDSDRVALEMLHEKEAELFGSSAANGKASKFTLRVETQSILVTHNTDWPNGGNDPSGYLGMGLWQMGDQEQREYISEGQSFSVEISFLKACSDDVLQQLKSTLMVWGIFGGLGSRSRRAFGSVALERLDQESFLFPKVSDYQEAVQDLFLKYRLGTVKQPPFSAFCKDTKFGIGGTLGNHARSAHASLGGYFKNYRGQPSSLRGSCKQVFGLPYSNGVSAASDARRASPLIFHIHPIGSKFVMTALFLPADFHHETNLANVDYSLASGFLRQLPGAILL